MQSLGSVSSRATSVTVTGLTPGVTSYLAVQAYATGATARSAWVSVTPPAPLVPQTPRGLTFTFTTATGGTLSWSPSAAATAYRVYAIDDFTGRTGSARVAAGTTSVTVSGLRSGGSYSFQVVAVNAFGSAASDLLPLVVPDAITPRGGVRRAAALAFAAQRAADRW